MNATKSRVLTVTADDPLPTPDPEADYVLLYGSRSFRDRNKLDEELAFYTQNLKNIVVIHGDCRTGADALAHAWALESRYDVIRFPPKWYDGEKYVQNAGFTRNKRMVGWLATCCRAFAVGFWDGESAGTKSTTGYLVKTGIPHRVERY